MGPNEADLSTRRSSLSQGAACLLLKYISPKHLLGLEGPVVCGSTMARKGGGSQALYPSLGAPLLIITQSLEYVIPPAPPP